MKKIYLVIFVCFFSVISFSQTPCVDGMAGIYPCQNVDLLAYVPLADIGNGANTNDIWGWVSPITAKEYALVGCSNGTAFLDITNPETPEYLGILPTHTVNNLWRDLETYNNYCFITSEATGHGLQVFDLLQLDEVTNTPVTFVEDAHYDGFGHCHTLTINVQSGYCYCNGTGTFEGGLHIVDISDPLNPVLAGGYAESGYTHDCFAWSYDGPDPDYAGREVIFACNGSTSSTNYLVLVDVTDKTDCQEIASYTYDQAGYTHQGWISKDKSHFLIDDEIDEVNLGNDGDPYGTRTHIFDVTDLDNSAYMGYYESDNIAIDHNLYIEDQFVYESNYRSGVRILDAVKVDEGLLKSVGYFDLYPANDFAQYSGTWSNYPYLPSGVNLATSMYDGFFILMPKLITLSQDEWVLCGTNEIIFDVQVNAELAFPLTVGLEGLGAATASADVLNAPGIVSVTITGLNSLTSGNYQPTLNLQTTFGEEYEVPFSVSVAAGLPLSPQLINVPDGSFISNTETSTLFEWNAVANANTYLFELSSDANFTSIIESESTDLLSFLLTYDLPDGTYFWHVSSGNECGESQWSQTFQFTILFIGIHENVKQNLGIYPNPVNDALNVISNIGMNRIEISDLSGRIIQSHVGLSERKSITLSTNELAPGVYMINVDGKVLRFSKQ